MQENSEKYQIIFMNIDVFASWVSRDMCNVECFIREKIGLLYNW